MSEKTSTFQSTLKRTRNTIAVGELSKTVTAAIVSIILLSLIGLPMLMYLWGSVWTRLPLIGGEFTLRGYEAFLNPSIHATLWNTLVFTIAGLFFSFGLAILLTFYALKLNTRGKQLIPAIIIGQFLLPGYIVALAWEIYAGPVGVLNQLLILLPFIEDPVINVRSVIGMAFVAGTNYAGLIYLLIAGGVMASSKEMEEAAILSGASSLGVFRRISIPLILPSLGISLVLVFVGLLQNFAIPLVLGLPERNFVVATRMFGIVRNYPPDYATSFALGVPVLIIAMIGLVIQQKYAGTGEKYETVGKDDGKPYLHVVSYQKAVSVFVWGIVVFIYIIPVLILTLSSFQATYTFDPFSTDMSLDNWNYVLSGALGSQFRIAWQNTILLGVVGGFLAMAITTVASYLITKTDTRMSRILNYLVLAPAGIPGIVIAVTFLWIVVELGLLGAYNSLIFVLIAASIPGIVYASRATNSSFRAIGSELEEAGSLCGANFIQILQKIYLPLIKPGFFAGYMLVFIFYIKNLSIPTLLITDSDEMLVQAFLYQQLRSGHVGRTATIATTILIGVAVIYIIVQRFGDPDATRF